MLDRTDGHNLVPFLVERYPAFADVLAQSVHPWQQADGTVSSYDVLLVFSTFTISLLRSPEWRDTVRIFDAVEDLLQSNVQEWMDAAALGFLDTLLREEPDTKLYLRPLGRRSAAYCAWVLDQGA